MPSGRGIFRWLRKSSGGAVASGFNVASGFSRKNVPVAAELLACPGIRRDGSCFGTEGRRPTAHPSELRHLRQQPARTKGLRHPCPRLQVSTFDPA
jgi:hypothetical protein